MRFRNANLETAYVGDAACFDCHEDEWRGYQEHGMAQSYYPLTPEHVVEDFSGVVLHHEATDFYYRMYEDGGRYFQEEYRLDADGRKTHQLFREMQYVVGSGTAARTYLTEQGGRIYELPVTWYTQKKKWDFSPGYDVHNARFDRLVPDRCMACHNSFPESVPFVEGKYEQVPEGIGCERCHGPGELHVEARLESPEASGDYDDTIVNPAHLSLDRRLDVCQQCHLQGTVSLLREGRGAFDFRPSEPLAAHVAIFAAEEPDASERIGVISHADRMKKSACFIATRALEDQAMDCTTCHNPHEGFRTKGPEYFNSTCKDCHSPAALREQFASGDVRAIHIEDSNCISCHMPKVEVEDAPHASFTDHWIRVVEQREDAPAPLPAHHPVQLEAYFDEDAAGDDGEIYRGMAYIVYGKQQGDTDAFGKGIEVLEAALPGHEGEGEAHFLLGYAKLQLGAVAGAIPALEQAVKQDPRVPERLNALAQAYEADQRDPSTIARLYDTALSIQPALADVRLNYGRFLQARGRVDEAIEQYQKARAEKAWEEIAYFNLGTAYLQRGDVQNAEDALRQALKLEPDYPEALGNLGLLYASQGRTDRAVELFEHAVAVAPDNATALGNLGTYYLNQGDLERAIDLLRRAVDAEPQYLDGLLNLALAYFRDEDYRQAERYAREALKVDPDNARARQILGAL